MGQPADRAGFPGMFLAVGRYPLLGLGGLRWLRGRPDRGGGTLSGPRAQAPK